MSSVPADYRVWLRQTWLKPLALAEALSRGETEGHATASNGTIVAWAFPESSQAMETVAKHLAVTTDSVCPWQEARKLSKHWFGQIWKVKLPELGEKVRAGGFQDDAGGRR